MDAADHRAPCCSASRTDGDAARPPGAAPLSEAAAPARTRGVGEPCRPAGEAAAAAAETVRIPGGVFRMGTDAPTFPADGEGPVRRVRVPSFRIDRHAVTNDRFARFVEATGYRTEAERYGWSFVFHLFVPEAARPAREVPAAPWWRQVHGARWDRPEGPGSDLTGRGDHPVVHVSWNDAVAFADWEGGRLPTEAEWEYAARGGLDGAVFPWGDELEPDGRHRCNVWQGSFPHRNTEQDGYAGTAPVDAFQPNGYGLWNMTGNTWEWCADWFGARHARGAHDAPKGPPDGPGRVMKGGSYLCHVSYCNRYRVAARTHNTADSATGHMGFRLVYDA